MFPQDSRLGAVFGLRELLVHGAIGDEGDRREEVPAHGQVFLDILEAAAGDRRLRGRQAFLKPVTGARRHFSKAFFTVRDSSQPIGSSARHSGRLSTRAQKENQSRQP